MRQAIVAIIMGIVLLSCTNARVIQYNTERLDNIEEYLRENKFIKPSENVEKLKEEGKIDFSHNPFSMPQISKEDIDNVDPLSIKEEGKINYSREYRSLEKEAETWKEDTK